MPFVHGAIRPVSGLVSNCWAVAPSTHRCAGYGLTPDELVGDDYTRTQTLADTIRDRGAAAMIVPSAALPETHNLILFGVRLLNPLLGGPLSPKGFTAVQRRRHPGQKHRPRDLHRQEALTKAFQALCALRVIEPAVSFLPVKPDDHLPRAVSSCQERPTSRQLLAAVDATASTREFKRWACFDVCAALTTQGIGFAELTPAAFLHYATETREAQNRGCSLGK